MFTAVCLSTGGACSAGSSIGSSDRVGKGPRNMKSMWSPLAAIFFMTYLYRVGGAMAPSAPPLDLLLGSGVPGPRGMPAHGECLLQGVPGGDLPRAATAVGSMHPTGMHSCLIIHSEIFRFTYEYYIDF